MLDDPFLFFACGHRISIRKLPDRQLPSGEEKRRGERDDEGKAEDRSAAEERGEEPEAERFAARGESGRSQGRLPHLQGPKIL